MAEPTLSHVVIPIPTYNLESLAADIQITLMSSSGSFKDLKALINASTIFLATFVAAKATILLAILSRELGPSMRDCFVLASTQRLQPDLDEAIICYQAFRTEPRAVMVRKISIQTICEYKVRVPEEEEEGCIDKGRSLDRYPAATTLSSTFPQPDNLESCWWVQS